MKLAELNIELTKHLYKARPLICQTEDLNPMKCRMISFNINLVCQGQGKKIGPIMLTRWPNNKHALKRTL